MSSPAQPSPTCQVSWMENGQIVTDGQPAVVVAFIHYRGNTVQTTVAPMVSMCQAHFDQFNTRQPVLGIPSPQPVAVTTTWSPMPVEVSQSRAARAVPSAALPVAMSISYATLVQITISPGSYTLAPGVPLQFTATVTGSSSTQVVWSAVQGSITSSGLYTAPATSVATTDTITATLASNHCVKASAQVSISAPVSVTVVVSPSSATVTAGSGQTIGFTAVVNGLTDQTVTWSAAAGGLGQTGVPAVGSVSPSGVYTAPASLAVQSFDNVIATSVPYPTASGFSTVTINPNVVVHVSPASASVFINGQQQFTASISGAANQTVTWSAQLGSITPGGLYTAPATAGIDRITATSTTIPGALAQVAVNVTSGTGVTVVVTPTVVTLNAGQTQQFTAVVNGLTNQNVTWSLQPFNAPPMGTISATGLYTAPAIVPNTFPIDMIVATSVADPAAVGVGNANLNPGTATQLDLVQWSVASLRTSQHLVGDPHAPYSVQMLDTDAGYPANYPRSMIWQIKNKLGNPWDARRYDNNYIYHWLTENGDSVDTATCKSLNGTTCWLYAKAYKRFVNPLRGWPRYLTPNAAPVVIDSLGPNTTLRTVDCEATLTGTITLGDVRTVTSGPTKYTWGGSIDHGAGTGANGPTLDSVNGVDTVVNLYYYSGTIANNDFKDREEYYFVLGFGEVAWYYYHRANASSPWVWVNQTVNSTLAATGSPAPNFPCGPGKSWFV